MIINAIILLVVACHSAKSTAQAFQLHHHPIVIAPCSIYSRCNPSGSVAGRPSRLSASKSSNRSVHPKSHHNDDFETTTTTTRASQTTRRSFLSSAAIISTTSALVSFASTSPPAVAASLEEAATYAYRSGGLPFLTSLGLSKLFTRYEGFVLAPENYYSKKGNTKINNLAIRFDFPTDWLQLDKLGGGIQYVDQRNGDKLYVLHAVLPEGADLKTVSKSWFGGVIFHPEGDVVRSGVVVDGYRVARSQMVNECSSDDDSVSDDKCQLQRRLLLKYDTVTGNGVQTVERRGLVDAHQIAGTRDVYMMVTASNAVKFEAKGSRERETVETIVNSFKIG